MTFTCCCTNQCPACGSCCQVNCGHRRSARGVTATGTTFPINPRPLTEDDIRRIIREEMGRRS